jgi:hypothetical protein
MKLEIKVFIPCSNVGCTDDTESYKVYDSEGNLLRVVDDAYEVDTGNEEITHDGTTYTKCIYVCSVICQEQVITRLKEMAR